MKFIVRIENLEDGDETISVENSRSAAVFTLREALIERLGEEGVNAGEWDERPEFDPYVSNDGVVRGVIDEV